ncbi:MAG: transcriptional regulator [Lysobacterales bacterium CG17_big_fil_post_rev_8_21_14_2_50_64_11]|nr:MAG: transcriptional regulator [Xanthomonadales bacterium CG17_big_fil_post_rev_8_21_14_2_50_64_11]PIX60834.1 MAG: transcriptional regulator [Xanthomonadales bacterium CG_4_10_14_3_um_filter_64_11]
MKDKVRNIGPKSAAWLRQVGIHSLAQLTEMGAVAAFIAIKRAGFRPSLNLLYALEGALLDCHWQEIPGDRRSELILAADAASALLPPARGKQVHNAPVSTTYPDAEDGDAGPIPFDPE